MSKTIAQIPEADRPREKLLRKGAAALSDQELLAVLLAEFQECVLNDIACSFGVADQAAHISNQIAFPSSDHVLNPVTGAVRGGLAHAFHPASEAFKVTDERVGRSLETIWKFHVSEYGIRNARCQRAV